MNLILSHASEYDLDRMVEVQYEAMASEPYHHVMYPGPNVPQQRAQTRSRILSDWKSDPSEQVLKVVDSSIGEIISYGKWNIYTQDRPKSEWDQHMEVDWTTDLALKEGAEKYLQEIHGMRHRHVTGQPHLLLNFLVTHPSHQRRGAASMIVKWGCQNADKLGLPAYLEATAAGQPIYLKEGFEKIDEVVIDCDRWSGGLGHGGVGKHRYTMLYRQPRHQA